MDNRLRDLERIYKSTGTMEALDQLNAYCYRAGMPLVPFIEYWQEAIASRLVHYENGNLVGGGIIRVVSATARGIIPSFGNKVMLTMGNYGFEDPGVLPLRLSSISEIYGNTGVGGQTYPPAHGAGTGAHVSLSIQIKYTILESGDIYVEEEIQESPIRTDCLYYHNHYQKPFPGSAEMALLELKEKYIKLLSTYWQLVSDCFFQGHVDGAHCLIAIENLWDYIPTESATIEALLGSELVREKLRKKARDYELNDEFGSGGHLPDYLYELSLRINKDGGRYYLTARIVYPDELSYDDADEEVDAETLLKFGTPNEVYEAMSRYLERQDEIDRIDIKEYGETWEGGDIEVTRDDEDGSVLVDMELSRELSIEYLKHLLRAQY